MTDYILTQLMNFCFYLNNITDFPIFNENKTWPDAFQTDFFFQIAVSGT